MWHARHQRAIDRHFAGDLEPRVEARMRAHVGRCPSCRARYDRHLVVEAAMPTGGERAADRLWGSIRAAAREGKAETAAPACGWLRSPGRLAFGGAVLAAAAVVFVAVPRHTPIGTGDSGARGLVPRGGGAVLAAPPSLHVYRGVSQHQAEALDPGAVVHSGDGLLFAYSNPLPTLTRLMVFAIDEANGVHWYYPAYVRAGEDPEAVPIIAGAIGVELGEEIRHALPAGALRVYALFLPEPHRVLEIEGLAAALARAPGGAVAAEVKFPLAGCTQTSLPLRVSP